MKRDIIIIPFVILAIAVFIFIKGFQSNMQLTEILSIFFMFTCFLAGAFLICASLIISIYKIFCYFADKI
jgi:hypothetical protein